MLSHCNIRIYFWNASLFYTFCNIKYTIFIYFFWKFSCNYNIFYYIQITHDKGFLNRLFISLLIFLWLSNGCKMLWVQTMLMMGFMYLSADNDVMLLELQTTSLLLWICLLHNTNAYTIATKHSHFEGEKIDISCILTLVFVLTT